MDAKKEFSRVWRGFDSYEVHHYLEQQAGHMEELKRENQILQQGIDEAREEIKQYRNREKKLEETLSQSRRLAEDIKIQAEREAKLMIAEAELRSEKLLTQSHHRLAAIHEDIAELKRQRTQFEVRLRSLVEAHLKLIDLERDRDREMSEMEEKIKILRSPA
jgi:cell division initiation protein